MTFDIQGPKTVQEVLEHLRTEHSLECGMLGLGADPFYDELQKTHKERLSLKVEDVFVNLCKNKVLFEG